MAGQLRYELVGDASTFQSAAQEAADAADLIDTNMEALRASIEDVTAGQIRFSDAMERFRAETGEFVSATDAQARVLEELNSVGVKTEAQYQAQIEQLERLQAAVDEGSVAYTQLESRIEGIQSEMRGFAASQEQVQSELRSTAAAQDRVQSSSVTMRSSVSASANNLGFEFVQAAQDARYGAAGVANQIPLMTEQFTQLSQKTGSTSAALRALGGSLFGTAGVIGAVTLALPLLKDMSSGLAESSESAEDAADSFEGLLQATKDLEQQLIPTGQQLENITQPLQNLDRPVTGVRALVQSLEGGLLAGEGTQAPERAFEARAEAVRRFAGRLQGSSQEAQFLRDALRSAGVEVGEITGAAEISQEALVQSAQEGQGAFTQARQAIINSRDALVQFAEDPIQAIEDQELAARRLRSELERISQRIQQERALPGLIDSDEEATQERVRALERAAQRVIQAPDLDIGAEEFGFLRERLEEANISLERLKETAEEEKTALQQANEAVAESKRQYKALRAPQGVALAQAQRTREAYEGGVRALRNVNRILARREAGIQATQVEGAPQNLEEAAVSAENLQRAMEEVNESIREFNQETDQTSDKTEDAGDEVDNNINNQIARGIQLSAQLGATLVQSARQGGLSFQQAFSSILQTVGQVLALSGNPIAGAALSGTGAFVGAFASGTDYLPRSGTALVGEEGPELVNLPGGSEIKSNRETQQALTPAPSTTTTNVNVTADLARVGPGELGVVIREVERYQSKHPPRR
jgi:5-bromo-4-chloroindolyl phosphate hydrolysis protein